MKKRWIVICALLTVVLVTVFSLGTDVLLALFGIALIVVIFLLAAGSKVLASIDFEPTSTFTLHLF